MCLAEDQHAVQHLAAQGADKALADRVHPRHLDSAAQNPGPGGLEYGVEGAGEVRSAVADQDRMSPNRSSRLNIEVAGVAPSTRRLAGGDATRCIRRVPCSMSTRTYSARNTVSTWGKSTAKITDWACRNCPRSA